jgi:AbrB family looped-hinge helix DNA binding protein
LPYLYHYGILIVVLNFAGGIVGKAVVTVKGQIVIPSKIRRKFGIKKGTQVYFYERKGEIVLKPITDEYIRIMAGFSPTKGRLLRALMEERAKEREL